MLAECCDGATAAKARKLVEAEDMAGLRDLFDLNEPKPKLKFTPIPRDPRLSRHMVTKLADNADHVWRCEVVSSGYHNGARCSPKEPHGGWNCGWAWTSTISAPPPSKLRRKS
jgi:hypothetical protein